MQKLTEYAVEKSTFTLQASFTDEDGSAAIPSAITWSLCDADGTIINELEDVEVSVPAATINIVLSGEDLALLDQTNDFELRYLEVSAIYDSDIGSDLPLKDQAEFKVLNLKSIS